MRPAQKTSPVKKRRGGGPVPRPRQQKKQVLGAFGERVPEVKGGRPPPKGSSAVKQRKGKGKGNLTMVDSSTGKRVRKSPTPFPGSPPRGRTKRGKDGIDILVPSKPKRGKGKGMGKLVPTPLRPKRVRPKDRPIITDETGKRIRRRKPVLMPVKGQVEQKKLTPAQLARKRQMAAKRQALQLARAQARQRVALRRATLKSQRNQSSTAPTQKAVKRTPTPASGRGKDRGKPVGDRRVPVSRRVPFRDTGKPPTARRTAKVVNDRRFPVSRRIRRR